MTRNLVTITALAFFLILLGCGPDKTATPVTSMYKGNPQLTGKYQADPLYQLDRIRFSFKTEGPIRSTPVANGTTLYFGSGDGNFYSIDTHSGKERWRFATGGAIHSSPALAGDLVYFLSRDGYFYALQNQTGKEEWKYKLGDVMPYLNGWDYFLSSPVIENETVYIGGTDGFLYAFHLSKPEVKWKKDVGSLIRTAPLVINDMVVAGTMDGYLLAFSKDTGEERWSFANEGTKLSFNDYGYDIRAILLSPAAADDLVVFGSRDGFLYGLDLNSGKERWRYDHNGSWVLGTTIGEMVYASSGSSAFVQAVDKKTGEEKWRFKTRAAVFTPPMIAGNVVHVADYQGNVYALESNSGHELWRFPMGRRSFSMPLIYEGVLYCASDDGVLYAVEGKSDNKPSVAPATKAVFWEAPDPKKPAYRWFRNGVDIWIRDYFNRSGYELMDSEQLKTFMDEQISTGGRSVVVFAENRVPHALLGGEISLLRRYLDAGGKVVFLGPNPLAYYYNEKTGELDSINFQLRPREQLGIICNAPGFINNNAVYATHVSDEGKRIGLRGWWVSYGYAESQSVTTVLGTNEHGEASIFLKNFGGPAGTGLLQLGIPDDVCTDLAPIKMAVEHGLDWGY